MLRAAPARRQRRRCATCARSRSCRFEDNESHSDGLYSFQLRRRPATRRVHGDRHHPFIARNLLAWETHYVLRPNLQFFLLDGLDVYNGVYGVYHPDYDAHVYRDIHFDNVVSEPINRGHDDDSIQYGSFTYENLTLENCRIGRDPLIQLACTSPQPGQPGHFRNVTIKNSRSHDANVVDLGGGPRNPKLEYGVAYYFHDHVRRGKDDEGREHAFPDLMNDGDYGRHRIHRQGRAGRGRDGRGVPDAARPGRRPASSYADNLHGR